MEGKSIPQVRLLCFVPPRCSISKAQWKERVLLKFQSTMSSYFRERMAIAHEALEHKGFENLKQQQKTINVKSKLTL